MIYIGIDPGVSGGIAALYGGALSVGTPAGFTGTPLSAHPMPGTPRGLIDLLVWIMMRNGRELNGRQAIRAWLENVHSSPVMGKRSAFTFGRGFGRIETALTGCQSPFDRVTPRRWQAALGCLSGGDKNVTKARAQALFPSVKVTHAIADALLIAEYGRRCNR